MWVQEGGGQMEGVMEGERCGGLRWNYYSHKVWERDRDIARTGMSRKVDDPCLLHGPKIFTKTYNDSTKTFATPELGL